MKLNWTEFKQSYFAALLSLKSTNSWEAIGWISSTDNIFFLQNITCLVQVLLKIREEKNYSAVGAWALLVTAASNPPSLVLVLVHSLAWDLGFDLGPSLNSSGSIQSLCYQKIPHTNVSKKIVGLENSFNKENLSSQSSQLAVLMRLGLTLIMPEVNAHYPSWL